MGSIMTVPSRQQPLSFRQDEVRYVMQRWRASESCSLVGVGSIGKSNLLQHLSDARVHKHFLGDPDSQSFHSIIVDPNLLGALPSGPDSEMFRCWAGYELIMHRLYVTFYPFDFLSESEATYFYETYQALHDGSNPLYPYMGLRYLELAFDIFFRKGLKIALMFDEFEELLKFMPVKFFQNMRGLRDANKKRLSYLTFSRVPLPVLVKQLNLNHLAIEPFIELFTDNLLYVGPYSESDAQRMIQDLMARNNHPQNENMTRFLTWATGGFAGLLRAAFRVIETVASDVSANPLSEEAATKLARRRPVLEECRTIWTSLTPSEQHVLKAAGRLIAFEHTPDHERAIPMLVQKKLLTVDNVTNALMIQPPVLRAFVSANPEPSE
jgi:hypothetical protein